MAAAYHLESLPLHLDKILPSQICGIDLILLIDKLDQSIIFVLGLASSIRISDILLVNDFIVGNKSAKKVVLLPEKFRLVLS